MVKHTEHNRHSGGARSECKLCRSEARAPELLELVRKLAAFADGYGTPDEDDRAPALSALLTVGDCRRAAKLCEEIDG